MSSSIADCLKLIDAHPQRQAVEKKPTRTKLHVLSLGPILVLVDLAIISVVVFGGIYLVKSLDQINADYTPSLAARERLRPHWAQHIVDVYGTNGSVRIEGDKEYASRYIRQVGNKVERGTVMTRDVIVRSYINEESSRIYFAEDGKTYVYFSHRHNVKASPKGASDAPVTEEKHGGFVYKLYEVAGNKPLFGGT